MAASAVESALQRQPHSRNRTLLSKPGKAKNNRDRRRRRTSPKPSALCSEKADGDMCLEVDECNEGRNSASAAPTEHQGKEPSLYHPEAPDLDRAVTCTITNTPPLSRPTHHTQNSFGDSTARSFHNSNTKRTNAMPPPHMRKKDSVVRLQKANGPAASSKYSTSTPTDSGKRQPPVCATKLAAPTALAATATDTYAATSITHISDASSTTGALSAQAESITKKLSSLGIKVHEPEPVTKASLVCYASSNETVAPTSTSDKANASVTPKPKPKPATALAVTATDKKGSSQNDRANVSDNSKGQSTSAKPPPNVPTASRAQRTEGPVNTSAPSSGGRRGGRAPRQSKWIKNRDIPKPDPDRWAINWTEDKDCRSLSSLNADDEQKRDVPPGIDPETGFMLTDYDGNWAPPPLDWDSRPAFTSEQTVETVEKWLDRVDQDMLGKDTWISQGVIVTADGTNYHFAPDLEKGELEQGDIAPHYWVPIIFGKDAPSVFWTKLAQSKAPEPQDDTDLEGVRPWWEKYAVSGRSVLHPLQHPEIKGIDPRETVDASFRRGADLGSLHHAENRKRAERAKIEAHKERRRKAQEKMRQLSEGHTAIDSETIKTGAVLYLRLAFPEDMARITEIYNHYVSNTVSAPEMEKRKDSDMLHRYEDITRKKLPFIVACEQGGQIKSRKKKKKNKEPITLPDKIVGFAYADDHHDPRGMYRFTCDVEVYTDSDHYFKGVGKCLLDKMIGMLDSDYIERGGYRVDSADLELGALRVISNIIITVAYESEERLEFKNRLLTQWLGFEKVADMKGTGVKLGQTVSMAMFQRKTGATIDPAVPPIKGDYSSRS